MTALLAVLAFLVGILAGVLLGAVLVFRYGRHLAVPAPPPPVAATDKTLVHEPKEPEEVAEVLLTDEAKRRMYDDFTTNMGLSHEEAQAAVDASIDALHRLGTEDGW